MADSKLIPGARLMVLKQIDNDSFYQMAEIMATRSNSNHQMEYYMHWIDFNKRLDEWVTIEQMNLNSLIEVGALKGNSFSSSSSNTTATATKAKSNKFNKKRKTSEKEIILLPTSDDLGDIEKIEEQKDKEFEKLRHGGSMTQRLEEISRVKNISHIEIGPHVIEPWYFSAYPESFCTSPDTTIYLCDFCLSYFSDRSCLQRHRTKCTAFHPPGNEIYRCGRYSFWELDGHKQKVYCRNLCLLSKAFLDHKTLFYDVDPFLFYLLTESDSKGMHLIGYFSKEKESADSYNVACILTLPQYQRKGFGRLLIDFSYQLTRREGKVGSPEKPLSDLGLLSYRSYWSECIVALLCEKMPSLALKGNNDSNINAHLSISIDEIGRLTGFTTDDILHTLQAMNSLHYRRGQHIIILTEKQISDYHRRQDKVKKATEESHLNNEISDSLSRMVLDPSLLMWTPPVFTASQLRFL